MQVISSHPENALASRPTVGGTGSYAPEAARYGDAGSGHKSRLAGDTEFHRHDHHRRPAPLCDNPRITPIRAAHTRVKLNRFEGRTSSASFSTRYRLRHFAENCCVALQVRPPSNPLSTISSCPVMKLAPSLARKTAATAMSAGRPARGMAWLDLRNSCSRSRSWSASSLWRPKALPKMPVTVPPGDRQLTLIDDLPSSIATHLVRCDSPAFATA